MRLNQMKGWLVVWFNSTWLLLAQYSWLFECHEMLTLCFNCLNCDMCTSSPSVILFFFSLLNCITHYDILCFLGVFRILYSVLFLDTDSKYITKTLTLGIIEAIFSTLGNGVYDVCILSGHCLCCIAMDCSDNDANAVLSQVNVTTIM